MQKENPPLYASSTTTATGSVSSTTTTTSEGNYFSVNPFLSPTDTEQVDSTTASLYSSIFSQSSNSPSDTSFDDVLASAFATEHRLCQASFILEYQQLYNRYILCLARLREYIKEVNTLREENDTLRLANADLAQRLSLLSQATIQNCLLSGFNHLNIGIAPSSSRDSRVIADPSPPPSIQQHRFDRLHVRSERVSLPKKHCGPFQMLSQEQTPRRRKHKSPNPNSTRHPVDSPPLPGPQKVYVPAGAKREEAALEFEVYNQGMTKTELCNKWQETGTCPYGENCQFAHGIKELRPVMRHPRYKTEVCRIFLAGHICPYGHRCHFRHSLTDEDRFMSPRSCATAT